MNFADTDPGIESELLDLSAVSLDRLRVLNSSVLLHAMSHVLERTGRLRGGRRSTTGAQGERVD